MISKQSTKGGILIMTLVFVVMFLVIFTALVNLTSLQHKESVLQAQDELAFQIAEAGLNYAHWRLSHNKDDHSPETNEFNDQLAGLLGHYEITIDPPVEGGTNISITSTGYTAAKPNRQVTLRARYGIPSLARYVMLTNSDLWYSGEAYGALRSNGGIRMDGTSDGLVQSAKETYVCQSMHGCSNETKPGVWGVGEVKELWEFPVEVVDYNALTQDLLDMKNVAQGNNSYYGPSGQHGYSLVFHDNNTYSIYVVTKKKGNVRSFGPDTGWTNMSHDINKRNLIETRSIPDSKLIFIEDDVWIEGEIRDRFTLAAGVFPDNPSTNATIILNGSITYDGVKDGSRAFAAIAQKDIMIPFFSAPDVLRLDGAYVAQKGKFWRRHYKPGKGHHQKTSLDRYGMIASNGVPVATWVDKDGEFLSGYKEGAVTYDPNFLYDPPPYFPTSGQYEFISWEQVE